MGFANRDETGYIKTSNHLQKGCDMGRRSFANDLEVKDREALNKRIRDRQYGDADGTLEFARSLGAKVSRSAVHRYILALKRADGLDGVAFLDIAATAPARTDGLSRTERLLIELGALRQREAEVLEELADMREKTGRRDAQINEAG